MIDRIDVYPLAEPGLGVTVREQALDRYALA